jgi:archaellum component FlaF (FlaF/FlaG flagellin family)
MNNFLQSIIKFTNTVAMKTKKNSPTILMITGIACGMGTVVAASIASTKVGKTTAEVKENVEQVNKALETGVTNAGESYSEEDSKKDLRIIYIQAGLKYAKLYAPAAALGALSIISLLASHNIISKRYVAMSAAYASVDKSFKEYRKRVVDRFGEDTDTELRYGVKAETKEVTVTDPETGEVKTVNQSTLISDPNLTSDYAVYFDKTTSTEWDEIMDMNYYFISAQESVANKKLDATIFNGRKGIFLNEIYDMLGLPRTAAGQIVGWTTDGPDGYIKIKIHRVEREVNGEVIPSLVLDFNVEGNIWDRM